MTSKYNLRPQNNKKLPLLAQTSALVLVLLTLVVSISGYDFATISIGYSLIIAIVVSIYFFILKYAYKLEFENKDLLLPIRMLLLADAIRLLIGLPSVFNVESSLIIIIIYVVISTRINAEKNNYIFIFRTIVLSLVLYAYRNFNFLLPALLLWELICLVYSIIRMNRSEIDTYYKRIIISAATKIIYIANLLVLSFKNTYAHFSSLQFSIEWQHLLLVVIVLTNLVISYLLENKKKKTINLVSISKFFISLMFLVEIFLHPITEINVLYLLFILIYLNINTGKGSTKYMLLSSAGGHWTQLRKLAKNLPVQEHNLIVLTEFNNTTSDDVDDYLYYSNKSSVRNYIIPQIKNIGRIIVYFIQYYPDVIVSTGTHVAVPMFLIAKLTGRKTIYIESFASIKKLNLTGKIMRFIADEYYVQHEYLLNIVPRAKYFGEIYNLPK